MRKKYKECLFYLILGILYIMSLTLIKFYFIKVTHKHSIDLQKGVSTGPNQALFVTF